MVGVIVTLIILLVSGIILISIYLVIGGSIIESTGQAFCTLSSVIRSKANIPGVDLKVYPELCETSVINIHPAKHKECPGYTTFITKYNHDNPDLPIVWSPRRCAEEQVVKLAASCWTQRGRGGLNPGDFTCFYSCVEPYYSLTDTNNINTFLSREDAAEEPQAVLNNFNFGPSELARALELKAASISGKNISYSNIITESEITVPDVMSSSRFIKVDFNDDTGKKPKDKIIITALGTGC